MLQNGQKLVAINLNESLESKQLIDSQKDKERQMGQKEKIAKNDDHHIPDTVHKTNHQNNSAILNAVLHTNQKQIESQATPNSIVRQPNSKDEEQAKNVNLITIQNEATEKVENESSVEVGKGVEKFTHSSN